ncbi:MAG: inositol monophosphatase family protein, partial [Pseudomonadota bacterium]
MASAPPATKQDLETAHLLADAARDVALPLFRSRALATESKADTRFDPVTEADRAIEARMREILAERHPDDGIVGEEHGIVTGSSGRAWVIDPIDGTRAFISGLPVWGVLIGLRHYEGAVEHGRSILGILDQPYTGERFVGTASGGERRAELHRGAQMTPLGVRPCAALEAATLMCTTPALFEGNGERAAYDRVENAVR